MHSVQCRRGEPDEATKPTESQQEVKSAVTPQHQGDVARGGYAINVHAGVASSRLLADVTRSSTLQETGTSSCHPPLDSDDEATPVR
jgi:hypothetical protein